eukprot:CAMPEP_0177635744 /NCGR_PEP_ID=MMETSP0447-20121125/4071_1 /TAXON_ID=0 /ORGANISM="Stygamoeba regulata, Strain BSH-02190019" /LENGTH=435 /DNA_ID=CAMNT_0019137565 /DNA_START=143 /DNA_END=1447 /DNA_ORIENTATION=+
MDFNVQFQGEASVLTLLEGRVSVISKASGGDDVLLAIPLADVLTVSASPDGAGKPSELAPRVWTPREFLFGSTEECVHACDCICASLKITNPTANNTTKRKILVLVNPFGGSGAGWSKWREAEPVFDLVSNETEVEVIETKSIGHAFRIGHDLKLEEVDAVVCVSGDGVMNEVLNGLLSRTDVSLPLTNITFGLIPAGTGNGFGRTFHCLDPVSAAFNICKGRTHSLDLIEVVFESKRYFCFLSFNWALISDVDFESETYRWLGSARLTVAAVMRILFLRCYTARLRFVEAVHADLPPPCTWNEVCAYCQKPSVEITEKTEEFTAPITVFGACNMAFLSQDANIGPFTHMSDGLIDVMMLKDVSRTHLFSLFTNMERSNTFIDNPNIIYKKVKEVTLEPQGDMKGCYGLDGERVAESGQPVTLRALKGAICVFVP